MIKEPWEYHAGLMPDRILLVTKIVVDARERCAEEFDGESGDTNWSYGCRARDWTRQGFREAEKSGEYPWLKILEDTNQKFIVAIDGVPFKFFKEDANDPKARVMNLSIAEADQLSLLEFSGIETSGMLKWRLLIDASADREVLRVVFAGFNNFNDAICFYEVDWNDRLQTFVVANEKQEDGIELSTPVVGLKIENAQKRKRSGE